MKYLLLLAILVLTQIGCVQAQEFDDGLSGQKKPFLKAKNQEMNYPNEKDPEKSRKGDCVIPINDEKASSRTDASCSVKWGLPLTILGSLAMVIPVMLKLYGTI